jgi:hypothetical protein
VQASLTYNIKSSPNLWYTSGRRRCRSRRPVCGRFRLRGAKCKTQAREYRSIILGWGTADDVSSTGT